MFQLGRVGTCAHADIVGSCNVGTGTHPSLSLFFVCLNKEARMSELKESTHVLS